jgi:hypothetical protein
MVLVSQPPLNFELECSDENGVTVWLEIFKPEDAELELVCL